MIIPIRFQYKKTNIKADLVYNFEAISDLMLVLPKEAERNSIEEYILLFKGKNNKWEFDGDLVSHSRFLNLSALLTSYFKDYHFSFENIPETFSASQIS